MKLLTRAVEVSVGKTCGKSPVVKTWTTLPAEPAESTVEAKVPSWKNSPDPVSLGLVEFRSGVDLLDKQDRGDVSEFRTGFGDGVDSRSGDRVKQD